MEARKIFDVENDHLRPEEKISLQFSKEWIEIFKKRYGILFRCVHGEAKSADGNAIRDKMPGIIRILMTYDDKDVWNADEFGLFLPSATILVSL